MEDSVIKRRMAGRPRPLPREPRTCAHSQRECRLVWLVLIGAAVMGLFGVTAAS